MLNIIQGDCREVLKTLPDESVQCCVTSPPYWGLRDYSVDSQFGLEHTPEEYVTNMVQVFREVRRVLRNDGTLWLNLGDSYSCGGRGGGMKGEDGEKQRSNAGTLLGPKKAPPGLKPKDLVGIPWRVAFALQSDGWYIRSDIIWHKPNPMPESVTDRPTKSHEYIFLLTKQERYFYDAEAIKESAVTNPHNSGYVDGEKYAVGPMNRNGHSQREDPDRVWAQDGTRNKRSVWTIPTTPYRDAHFATYPPDLIKPCILAGTSPGDTVIDPFSGSGTTGMVSIELGRSAILIELNPEYVKLAQSRCNVTPGLQLH